MSYVTIFWFIVATIYLPLVVDLKFILFACFRPKFRSYRPQDETLQEVKLDDAVPAELEEEVKDLLEAGKEKVRINYHTYFVFPYQ